MKYDCENVRQILIGYFEVPLVPEAFGQLPGLYHPIVILGAELMMWMLELHAEMEVPVISDPLVIAVGWYIPPYYARNLENAKAQAGGRFLGKCDTYKVGKKWILALIVGDTFFWHNLSASHGWIHGKAGSEESSEIGGKRNNL